MKKREIVSALLVTHQLAARACAGQPLHKDEAKRLRPLFLLGRNIMEVPAHEAIRILSTAIEWIAEQTFTSVEKNSVSTYLYLEMLVDLHTAFKCVSLEQFWSLQTKCELWQDTSRVLCGANDSLFGLCDKAGKSKQANKVLKRSKAKFKQIAKNGTKKLKPLSGYTERPGYLVTFIEAVLERK